MQFSEYSQYNLKERFNPFALTNNFTFIYEIHDRALLLQAGHPVEFIVKPCGHCVGYVDWRHNVSPRKEKIIYEKVPGWYQI